MGLTERTQKNLSSFEYGRKKDEERGKRFTNHSLQTTLEESF
jgi:hypothetical protein